MPEHNAADPVRLLAVGELTPASGFDALLRVMATLVRSHAGVRLIIAGEGPQHAALARQVSDLRLGEAVILPGAVPRTSLVEWLQRAHVFVLPRTVEAPRAVPPALPVSMAGGLCVVATEVGGVVTMLTDGVDSLVVPPGDDDALERALQMVVSNPGLRQNLGEAAALSIRGLLRSA